MYEGPGRIEKYIFYLIQSFVDLGCSECKFLRVSKKNLNWGLGRNYCLVSGGKNLNLTSFLFHFYTFYPKIHFFFAEKSSISVNSANKTFRKYLSAGGGIHFCKNLKNLLFQYFRHKIGTEKVYGVDIDEEILRDNGRFLKPLIADYLGKSVS